jgi:hypothetical protein
VSSLLRTQAMGLLSPSCCWCRGSQISHGFMSHCKGSLDKGVQTHRLGKQAFCRGVLTAGLARSRWCFLLLRVLAEVDWTVLGVSSEVMTVRGFLIGVNNCSVQKWTG